MESKLLSMLLFFCLLHIVVAFKPLTAISNTTEEFAPGDRFDNNLVRLMFRLATDAPRTGFEIASVGVDRERVYGLAMCRGDVGSGRCFRCLNKAVFYVRNGFGHRRNKDAVIWYENCMLRYSNEEFFGEIDYNHTVMIMREISTRNAANPILIDFNKKVITELMNRLTTKAYISPLLFATGQTDIQTVGKLSGLVQCTKDLSGRDCKTCLETAISRISPSRGGPVGARIFGGSCSVRYELYRFFDY